MHPTIVTTFNFEGALEDLKGEPALSVDLETTGLKPFHGDQIVGIAVSNVYGDGLRGYYFPFGHEPGGNLPYEALRRLRPVLADKQKLYVGHNYKFDLRFLVQAGFDLPRYIADTMVGATLANENEESFGLKQLGDKYIGASSSLDEARLMKKLQDLGHRGKKAKAFMYKLPVEDVAPYAVQDVFLTTQLFHYIFARVQAWGLSGLWSEYNQYVIALLRAELRGIRINPARIQRLMADSQRTAAELQAKIRRITGLPELNINSPKQLSEVLGIPSTAKEVLQQRGDELSQLILEYRHYSKVNGTYYGPYLSWADQKNTIHPSFKVGGTVTGRLSCYDPNLQQVPRDGDTVKSAFVARPGKVLIEADYEQAELRLAAHLAGEQTMIDIFNEGRDPHFETAVSIFRTEAVRTAKLLLMRDGISANGSGPEVLSTLRGNPPEGGSPETRLGVRIQDGTDQESGGWQRECPGTGAAEPQLDDGDRRVPAVQEIRLRTVQQHPVPGSSPQRSGQVEQPTVEPADAVQILSRYGASACTELDPEWDRRRQIGKTLNFSVIYGAGARKFAATAGVSEEQGREWLTKFYQQYPNLKTAAKSAEKEAKDFGYVKMWSGRIRRFPDPEDAWKAFNAVVQGGVAEVIRRAIVRLDKQGVPILGQVHDSILFEVPESSAPFFIRKITEAMEADNDQFTVPQRAEVKVGTSWGDMRKVEQYAA